MNVLVTGAAGFIGSHIVDLAVEKGHKVYGIDSLITGKIENVNPKCEFIRDDIREFDYETLGKLDGIFHTAALARIQPSFLNPVSYESTNVIGTLLLIEYAMKSDSKLIFSSSSSVYGVQGRLSSPMDESYPLNPSSPYAVQKLTCERYLELFRKFGNLRYMALRYFNVYGPRQIKDGDYAAVVGIFLGKNRDDRPFPIYGDGSQRRDFTFVKDVALANLLALESNIDSGIYNIGSGANHSVLDIANFINYTNPIEYLPKRNGEAAETLADYRRAFTDFGWQPQTKINEWLKSEVSKG